MAFVLEGQADSSQARSAWVAIQGAPVPEGRSNGRSHCQSQRYWSSGRRNRVQAVQAVLETPGILLKGMLASNLSRDPFNRPAGTGLFYS
jgi:hypothetical protein